MLSQLCCATPQHVRKTRPSDQKMQAKDDMKFVNLRILNGRRQLRVVDCNSSKHVPNGLPSQNLCFTVSAVPLGSLDAICLLCTFF